MIKDTVSTVFLRRVCSKVKVGNRVFIQWISKVQLLSLGDGIEMNAEGEREKKNQQQQNKNPQNPRDSKQVTLPEGAHL